MTNSISLGWEEWVSLPKLGLPAIKAKVDTGARTSALHAVAVEPFGSEKNPQVRFIMHPDPDDPHVEVVCSAKVIGRRMVVSSNGESESRFVIESPLSINGESACCWVGRRSWKTCTLCHRLRFYNLSLALTFTGKETVKTNLYALYGSAFSHRNPTIIRTGK